MRYIGEELIRERRRSLKHLEASYCVVDKKLWKILEDHIRRHIKKKQHRQNQQAMEVAFSGLCNIAHQTFEVTDLIPIKYHAAASYQLVHQINDIHVSWFSICKLSRVPVHKAMALPSM